MIPKVIHYCWFGEAKMSPLHQRCLDSWKKYCPDYELRLWNEKNSDLDNAYCREALIQKKWAFISDWVRFDVLSKHGGFYLDTDLELIKPLDELVPYSGCVIARESSEFLGTAFLACGPGDPVMTTARRLVLEDLSRNKVFATSPVIAGHAVSLHRPDESIVLDEETFFPFNPHDREKTNNARQLMYSDITPRTIGIHHFGLHVSWVDSRLTRAIFKLRKAVALQQRWDISFTPFDHSI